MFKKWLLCECLKRWDFVAFFILRIVTGAIFVAHGYLKLNNLSGTEMFFSSLGIPDPGTFVLLVGCVEFFGGLALMLGFMIHWAAKCTGLVALFAFLLVHAENGFFVQNGGYEFALLLLASTVAIACMGSPKWSLDLWMEKNGWKSTRM